MENFPIFLKLQGRPCLVVGGGLVAARKTQQLLAAGTKVIVVAPEIEPALNKLKQSGQIHHLQQIYDEECLQNMELVIAATDDTQLNSSIAEQCRLKNILINVVNNPKLGSFIMPSVIDRSPVIVAVSTGGASPVLARLLRAHLETLIPSS